eukprot:487850-Pelagomonas_calceolata.AAC.10
MGGSVRSDWGKCQWKSEVQKDSEEAAPMVIRQKERPAPGAPCTMLSAFRHGRSNAYWRHEQQQCMGGDDGNPILSFCQHVQMLGPKGSRAPYTAFHEHKHKAAAPEAGGGASSRGGIALERLCLSEIPEPLARGPWRTAHHQDLTSFVFYQLQRCHVAKGVEGRDQLILLQRAGRATIAGIQGGYTQAGALAWTPPINVIKQGHRHKRVASPRRPSRTPRTAELRYPPSLASVQLFFKLAGFHF